MYLNEVVNVVKYFIGVTEFFYKKIRIYAIYSKSNLH